MKKKLILHVGTGKTGSTALQHHLAAHRPELAAAGVLYPDVSCMVGGQRHYQNGLASARIGEKAVSWAALTALDTLASDTEHDRILLSIEMLGVRAQRGGVPGTDVEFYQRLRRRFVRQLGRHLHRFDVQPVIFLRRQDGFVESGYKQYVKTLPAPNEPQAQRLFRAYRDVVAKNANYDFQVALLRKYLGEPIVLRYEDGDVINRFLRALDLPTEAGRTERRANVSAPAALTGWMRALPVGTVAERSEFADSHAGDFTTPGARTLWESQAARDEYLARFATLTYGGDYFPRPAPLEPASALTQEQIAALSLDFGERRRGRAAARRMRAFVA